MVPASAFKMSSLGTSLVAAGMVFLSMQLARGPLHFQWWQSSSNSYSSSTLLSPSQPSSQQQPVFYF